MKPTDSRVAAIASSPFLALTLASFLTGCALGPITTDAPSGTTQGLGLHGQVHGGQQPVTGSHVYLFAANTTGYGGNGIAASASNASISLLNSVPGSTTMDTSGGATNGDYYVTTDSSGNFTITSDYTCTSGQQVYLYALGGNPGSTQANSAIGLMAALGTCPSAGNFESDSAVSFININEVSTVAAAYALAGFSTDVLHISSSGTALAQAGIANAFVTAADLETLATGVANMTTPSGSGTISYQMTNGVADILAACVNSLGPTSTACSQQFSFFKSSGATGTQATDTATEAIYIAQNPSLRGSGSSPVGLISATSPFQPTIQYSGVSDLSMTISFSNSGCKGPDGGGAIAVDESSNVWSGGSGCLVEISNAGAILSGSGYTAGGLNETTGGLIGIAPSGYILSVGAGGADAGIVAEINGSGGAVSPSTGYGFLSNVEPIAEGFAVDGSGNAWVPVEKYLNSGNSALVEVSPSGGYNTYNGGGLEISGPGGFGVSGGKGPIAIDSSGHVWIANNCSGCSTYTGGIVEFTTSGNAVTTTPYSGGGIASNSDTSAIAIDAAGNVWACAGQQGNVLGEINSSGAPVAPSTGYGSCNGSLAIDGAGNVWTDTYEYNSSGTPRFSSYYGVLNTALNFSQAVLDGSGNLWASASGNGLYEFVGAGAPVVTPLALAVQKGMLGTRP